MDDLRQRHEDNRQGWNDGAVAYERELQDEIELLRAGGHKLIGPELDFLGDLKSWCGRAIHLQCAGGSDTLSLWNLGAKEVVGVDISDRMIAVAEAKSRALNAPAQWFRCDILDTPEELDGTADLVYTGKGAICWLMDLAPWAAVVARLLKPGGRFYLFEGHPISSVWNLDGTTYELDPVYEDYFNEQPYPSQGWPSTYIGDLDKPIEEHPTKWERGWRVDQILNALIGAGLRIERVGEHPDLFWDTFPNMPADIVRRLPQTLSVLAKRP